MLYQNEPVTGEGSQEFFRFLRDNKNTEAPVAMNSTKGDSGAGCVLAGCGIVCVVGIAGTPVVCTGSVTVAFPHLLKNSTLPDVQAAK
ncbi:MAG: hypothetical protein M0Q91_02155 [Methanoregula sp.]|nr:hypothetical protein [Methanoregula sp.]